MTVFAYSMIPCESVDNSAGCGINNVPYYLRRSSVRVKHLQYFAFVVLGLGLAGCATNIPKVSYNGPIPEKSVFTNQTVAIRTSVHGDKFHIGKGCILEFSTKCRDLTLPGKVMIHSYNTLLAQGLKSDGAQADPGSSAPYVIYTHMVPSGKHHYLFMKDYDIGRTMEGAIPFAALFTGRPSNARYYTIVAHFDDDVEIMRNGKVVWHKVIPMTVKTRVRSITGHVFSSGHSGKSKAENIYRVLQSRAVAQILKASEYLEIQGDGTKTTATGVTVPHVS